MTINRNIPRVGDIITYEKEPRYVGLVLSYIPRCDYERDEVKVFVMAPRNTFQCDIQSWGTHQLIILAEIE